MSEEQGIIRDEANYRKLQEPFPSFAAANEALNAFFHEVRELRNKHKLPDVYVIVKGSALAEDGHEGEWMISQHHGSNLESEPMTAWAAGFEAAQRQQRIAKIIDSAGTIRKKEPRK